MKRNILVVDDEKDVCWILSSILKTEGYEVAVVGDGQKALEYTQHRLPDAVFLDLRLPNLDGMQALERIKAFDHLTPVIVITAYEDIKSAVQAMKLGAFDYLTKPFRNDEILLIIDRALKNRDLQIEKLKLKQKLRELQEQMFRSEKLASLGQLTAGVAHEIMNPLNIISCHVQRLLMDQLMDSRLARSLKVMEDQVKRITRIAGNLLGFSRQTSLEKTTLDLNLILEDPLSLVEPEMGFNNIQIIKKLNPDLPSISGAGHQLAQVFLNLITNARDAMPDGGSLTITTSYLKDFIEISFQDTGCGISEENLKRIFDPFFTTKEIGKGTGLGLSIAFGIVEKHGGLIKAKSEEGKGATFIVKLPING